MCWHCTPEGTFSAFSQAEGFAQGCPLSPLFASLVLCELLTDLNEELRGRSKTCLTNHSHPGDDNLGSLSQTKSHVDDTNMLLPCRDMSWFLRKFTALGEPLGIALNRSKTQILIFPQHPNPLSPIQTFQNKTNNSHWLASRPWDLNPKCRPLPRGQRQCSHCAAPPWDEPCRQRQGRTRH
jgi:hypothetical protein